MDFTPPHHPNLGIDHANIAKSLDNTNWKSKAIVRGGNYLMIHRGRYDQNNQTHIIYDIIGLPDNEHKQFNNLDEALDFINNFSNKEGEIPKEEEPNWYITTLNKLNKIEPFKKFDEEFKDIDPKIKLEVIDSVMKKQKEKLEKKSDKKKSLFESLYLND